MDALSEVLRVVKLDSAIFLNAEFSEPWCLSSPDARVLAPMLTKTEHVIVYHLLADGRAYVELKDGSRIALSAGDLVTFPHGDGHLLGKSDDTVAYAKGSKAAEQNPLWDLDKDGQVTVGELKDVIPSARNRAGQFNMEADAAMNGTPRQRPAAAPGMSLPSIGFYADRPVTIAGEGGRLALEEKAWGESPLFHPEADVAGILRTDRESVLVAKEKVLLAHAPEREPLVREGGLAAVGPVR